MSRPCGLPSLLGARVAAPAMQRLGAPVRRAPVEPYLRQPHFGHLPSLRIVVKVFISSGYHLAVRQRKVAEHVSRPDRGVSAPWSNAGEEPCHLDPDCERTLLRLQTTGDRRLDRSSRPIEGAVPAHRLGQRHDSQGDRRGYGPGRLDRPDSIMPGSDTAPTLAPAPQSPHGRTVIKKLKRARAD